MRKSAGAALGLLCAIAAPEVRAQVLPDWKIAEICAKDSATGYCAAFEGTAFKAVSGSWPFVPEPVRKTCLDSIRSPADRSWRLLGECVEDGMARRADGGAVKTSRTPGEAVPPPRPVAVAAEKLALPAIPLPTGSPFAALEAEAAARLAAEAEARRKAEAETEAKRKAEAEAAAKRDTALVLPPIPLPTGSPFAAMEAEAAAKIAADAEAKRRADAEAAARLAAAADAKRKADADVAAAKIAAEAEAKRRADAEAAARLAAAADAKRKADADVAAAKLAAETEAKRRAEAESAARLAAEADAKRRADAEAAALEARRVAELKACQDRVGLAARSGVIRFPSASAAITDDTAPTLARVAEAIKACPNAKLGIEGHTDASGDAGRNKELSARRAETVVAVLVKAGVEPWRLTAVGIGAAKPVAGNDTEEGRGRNRRIEFVAAEFSDTERKAAADADARRKLDAAALAERSKAAARLCEDGVRTAAASGPIRFRSGSSTVHPDSVATLDAIAAALKPCPALALGIEGHTDATGNAADNKELSENRASAVAAHLIRAGIEAKRLKSVGHGQSKPVAANDTEDNRAKNRRIDFVPAME